MQGRYVFKRPGGLRGSTSLMLWMAVASLAGVSHGSIMVYSTFSWDGIRGNMTFTTEGPGHNVTVGVSLEITSEIQPEPEEYDWAIHEWPVMYDSNKRCDDNKLGDKKWDLSTLLGKLTLPMETPSVYFETDKLSLTGKESIWGRSIRVKGTKTTCANVHGVGGEKSYEARFFSPVGGAIWMRSWQWDAGIEKDTQFTIFSDLFYTAYDEPIETKHEWNLYITDILDHREDRQDCNFLSQLYDPDGRESCDPDCPWGMLSSRHGLLTVGKSRSRQSRQMWSEPGLILPDLSSRRKLYVGLMDKDRENRISACGKLRDIHPKQARAIFNTKGVTGQIMMEQPSPFAPTDLTLELYGLMANAGGFHVHKFPSGPKLDKDDEPCGRTSGHFNPYETDGALSPMPGLGSHDLYEVGDLSGKHGMLTGLQEVTATVTDHNLPLFGPRSVMGRSVVVHTELGARWVCGNIRPTLPVVRAQVVFTYPIVGEILMEQEEEDYLADTMIFVKYLVYSDGSRNTTHGHRWHVHDDIPGKDYYNWTGRCNSAGAHYNPYKISISEMMQRGCHNENHVGCEMGDMSKRHGKVSVSGTRKLMEQTQLLLTDTNLPLSGPYTILGHSIVIHDDSAPKHRGDRMACTGIFRKYRHKAVVNHWTHRRDVGSLDGKIEMIQETEYDVTNTEVDLRGLESLARGYHVHMVPVPNELEFPCSGSVTYDHFNPLNVTPADSPEPATGTHDLYELGDLSGKYGTLENMTWLHNFYNDTNLPLFGPTSIMGRSVVIHKKEQNERWFCGSLGWGFSPSEARQVSAIASFHHPKGYAWGYIRMRQLVYVDGSLGETTIEVSLRHPGANNKNITRGHHWSIYVNPVGVDASVKFYQSRCVASGYRWNPYLIQLAYPLDREWYDRECSPELPRRCEVGDLSGRLGPINMGDKRQVFTDVNFPLAGAHSAMGRGLIVHNEQGKVERYACANIEPDYDIVKDAKIRKTPKFTSTIFMKEVREVLGVPEWFLAMDLTTLTFSADDKCVSFRLHFMGPYARTIEQDFARLMATGQLEKPSVSIPGYHLDPKRKKKVRYETCGGLTEDDIDYHKEKGKSSWWNLVAAVAGSSTRRESSSVLTLFLSVGVFFLLRYQTRS